MYTYGQDNVYVEFGKARKITTVSKTGVVLYWAWNENRVIITWISYLNACFLLSNVSRVKISSFNMSSY